MTFLPAENHYPRLTDYLAKLYGVPVYTRAGIKHPILHYPPTETQIENIDSVIGRLVDETPSEFAFYNHGYLQTMQNSGRNIFNGVTFALKQVQLEPLKLDFNYGYYFDMLATCGAFEIELRDAIVSKLIRLPGRSQYHREISHNAALVRGTGRSAAIGGACLTVFNHEGAYKAMLARRSAKNATDPGFFHLLPAFIFQPRQYPAQPHETQISYHIFREYLEELFAMPETVSPTPLDREETFFNHPAYRYLQDLMQAGKAGLYLTGVALNLLTLRPEICALLLIHDPAWYARITAPDSDMPLNADAETQHGITLVPIERDEALLAALPPNVHTIMPPQAVVALWEGVDVARKMIQRRNMPENPL